MNQLLPIHPALFSNSLLYLTQTILIPQYLCLTYTYTGDISHPPFVLELGEWGGGREWGDCGRGWWDGGLVEGNSSQW